MIDVYKSQKKTDNQEKLNKVFEKRPLLKELLERCGELSLQDFSHQNLSTQLQPNTERRKEFLETFKKNLEGRLGKEIANEVAAQMERHYFVSTADHHGTINSGLSVSSNLLLASGYEAFHDPLLKYIVVLSCAGITQKNEDFPRGLLVHLEKDSVSQVIKLPILPHDYRSSVLYGFPAYTLKDIEKTEQALQKQSRTGEMSEENSKMLLSLIDQFYKSPEVLQLNQVCEQFTVINFHLWKSMFPSPERKDLIYLEQEGLVSQLLLDHHLDQETLLNKAIFDPTYTEQLIRPLVEAMEPYLRQGFVGDSLFWGLTKDNNYRTRLTKQGNELISEDGSIRIALTADSIRQALKNRAIFPNIFLSFLVLHLYYGLNCLGGFNQMHYLETMQKAYNQTKLDSVDSNGNSRLYNYGMGLLFHEPSHTLIHGLDILLQKDNTLWGKAMQATTETKLVDLFLDNIDVVYNILYPPEETVST